MIVGNTMRESGDAKSTLRSCKIQFVSGERTTSFYAQMDSSFQFVPVFFIVALTPDPHVR
jgi:hypothetical protein